MAHHSKEFKLWRLSKIEDSVLKFAVPTLWPRYIGERRTTFAKAYGIKVRCFREHVGEHNGNLGNMCELIGNLGKHGGTHWEQEKNEKKKKSFSTSTI